MGDRGGEGVEGSSLVCTLSPLRLDQHAPLPSPFFLDPIKFCSVQARQAKRLREQLCGHFRRIYRHPI